MKYFLLCSLLFLVSCADGGHEIPYDNPAPNATGSSTQKKWKRSDFPLTVYIPTALNDYRIAIENSQATYRQAFGFEVFNFIFDDPNKPNTQWAGTYDSLNDNYFGLFKMTSWSFNNSNIDDSVLAFTGTLTQTGTILHADILFNFKTYAYGDVFTNPSTTIVDYESVLSHELGHFLGLGHIETTEDPISIMNPTIRKGQAKRYLSPNDVERIRDLYNL